MAAPWDSRLPMKVTAFREPGKAQPGRRRLGSSSAKDKVWVQILAPPMPLLRHIVLSEPLPLSLFSASLSPTGTDNFEDCQGQISWCAGSRRPPVLTHTWQTYLSLMIFEIFTLGPLASQATL